MAGVGPRHENLGAVMVNSNALQQFVNRVWYNFYMKAKKQRVIVYIDGYNLYYGLRSAYKSQYKWLDLQALSETLLRPGMVLTAVKYFTAITNRKNTTHPRKRQEIYLRALQTYCNKLKIYYGRFSSQSHGCRKCGKQYAVFEEKKTDVNIACQILNDTHLDHYDRCYIVSGDSDLVPPLQIIKENYPNKQTIVAHPPHRKSKELCKIADGWFAINRQKFKNSQLPEKIISLHGGELLKPAEWRQPSNEPAR